MRPGSTAAALRGGGGRESLTRLLARTVRERSADGHDLEQAERYVRDWLGSFTAGSRDPTGGILRRHAADCRDLDGRVFLAASLSHVTETDDLHNASVTHPGCVVVPVALLLGREMGARGRRVLRAVLAGYEVMTRIGEGLGPGHYRTFHNTATAGAFGACAAAAELLGIDEDGWVHAFGSAGTQAAGLWQFNVEGAMSKPLHAGHAASSGLRAARLAAAGLTGAEWILEGEKGLFHALCPDARPEAVLRAAPGWKLPETSMKPYPCCRHVHPAIDAALEVRDALGTGSVAEVRIESYPAALDVTDRPAPRTRHEARFSLQYAVARTLLHGPPGLDAFTPEALTDPRLREILARTTVTVDGRLAAAYPERWGARVGVSDGTGRLHVAKRTDASGDPRHPLDDRTLDEKVRGLCRWAGMRESETDALLRACGRLVADGEVPVLPAPPCPPGP